MEGCNCILPGLFSMCIGPWTGVKRWRLEGKSQTAKAVEPRWPGLTVTTLTPLHRNFTFLVCSLRGMHHVLKYICRGVKRALALTLLCTLTFPQRHCVQLSRKNSITHNHLFYLFVLFLCWQSWLLAVITWWWWQPNSWFQRGIAHVAFPHDWQKIWTWVMLDWCYSDSLSTVTIHSVTNPPKSLKGQ